MLFELHWIRTRSTKGADTLKANRAKREIMSKLVLFLNFSDLFIISFNMVYLYEYQVYTFFIGKFSDHEKSLVMFLVSRYRSRSVLARLITRGWNR